MPRRRSHRVAGQQIVVPSAARTTTGNSGAFTGWSRGGTEPQSRLSITAASGTSPNLTLTIQDSPDGTTWTTRDTYPAQTGVATVTRPLPFGLDAYQRVVWTLTGTTPSFTFAVQFASSTAALV